MRRSRSFFSRRGVPTLESIDFKRSYVVSGPVSFVSRHE